MGPTSVRRGGTTPQMMQDTSVGTRLRAGRQGEADRAELGKTLPRPPELPTIAETLPGFELDGWLVVVAPVGTPADIVTQLNRHIGQFLRSAEIQQRLVALGLAVSGTDMAETTAQFIRQQQAQWPSLAQELDLRPE
jgi:tripartite-type tricarboxylate transporter receptor subunit TctC